MGALNSKLRGRHGEEIAARYLLGKGYAILETNYRSRFGEIDLIARMGEVVAFVEVKLRKSSDFAYAYEAVTVQKQAKIKRTALLWLAQSGGDPMVRFDIVEIYTEERAINHIEGAFM